MTSRGHVEDRLRPLALGELADEERREVEAHLAGCPPCRQTHADYDRLAGQLAQGEAPAVHWGAYRAELRDKLDRRRSGRAGTGVWGLRPVAAGLAAGLVALMVYIGAPGSPGRNGDAMVMDDAVLASRLELIAHLDLVQRLDLLEDLDVIGRLDSGVPRNEG
jgi:anti-sigma factor RsiW